MGDAFCRSSHAHLLSKLGILRGSSTAISTPVCMRDYNITYQNVYMPR